MKSRIKWIQNKTFLGESGSGHSIIMDSDPQNGGRNLGIRPMEAILMGLGGCTAYDVVNILSKSREDLIDCEIELEAERAESVPKIFTKITLKYKITGNNLSIKKVERAVNLSAEKYCSASLMLGKTAEITHQIEIINTD